VLYDAVTVLYDDGSAPCRECRIEKDVLFVVDAAYQAARRLDLVTLIQVPEAVDLRRWR
jgi:hypothetical protein